MHDAFLRSLLENPRDDASRLVYADWLEEQDDSAMRPQAEYLRLTVALAEPGLKKGKRKAGRKRLQELARHLDTDWLAVVARIPVENCAKGETPDYRGRSPVYFRVVCGRDWADLAATGDVAVRSCDECREDVHYCATIREARDHAQAGRCIAVDLGVIRRENDLAPPDVAGMVLGRPGPGWFAAEEARRSLDVVSEERERLKRERQEAGDG